MSTFQHIPDPVFREAVGRLRPRDREPNTPPAPLAPGEHEYERSAFELGYELRGHGVDPATREELTQEANDFLAALPLRNQRAIKAREFRKIYERFDVTLPDALEIATMSAARRRTRKRLHDQGRI